MGLWMRLRQNLSLKIISLITAVLLYAFVQQERNPTTPRTVLADIVFRNLPEGYEVVSDSNRIPVGVLGPRNSVDRLKDGDIKAYAYISPSANKDAVTPAHLQFELPRNVNDVVLDAPMDLIQVKVYKKKQRKIDVTAIYKKDAPPGLRYSSPVIRPAQVTIFGREDRVTRVDKVVASASPLEPMANVDGDFPLSPRDSDNNPVEGISIMPETVHISISQVYDKVTRTLPISVSISDQPLPPYHLGEIRVTPNEVVISGTLDHILAVSRLETERLSVRDLTEDKTMELHLIRPPGIVMLNKEGRSIDRVTVSFQIIRGPSSGPVENTVPPNTVPPIKKDGTGGPQ